MSEQNFIKGLIVKAPSEKAPDFVKAKLSIKREELISWLNTQEGEWINADILVSKEGKYYAKLDTWKPENKSELTEKTSQGYEYPENSIPEDAIPFQASDKTLDTTPEG